MQSLEDPLILMIAFVITIMLVTIAGFTILGKAGKRTLRTYGKGRTASEKSLYLFATVGILTILIVSVFLLAFAGFLVLPIVDTPFDLSFIVDNVYLVGAAVFGIGLLMVYTLIYLHQRGTDFGEAIKKTVQKKGD